MIALLVCVLWGAIVLMRVLAAIPMMVHWQLCRLAVVYRLILIFGVMAKPLQVSAISVKGHTVAVLPIYRGLTRVFSANVTLQDAPVIDVAEDGAWHTR